MKPIKKLLRRCSLAAMTVVAFGASAQDPYAGLYEVNTINSRTPEYRKGEVIVKFKNGGATTTRLKAVKGKVKAATQASALNSLLDKYGATEAEELMPLTGGSVTPKSRRARAFNGSTVDDSDLSALYVVRLEASKVANINEVVREFAALPEVEYAEPNYILHACASAADYVSDPMYPQQWGVTAINLDKLWEKPVIDTKRPVIAILDTGVDISHPDLADNIWSNQLEAEGVQDYDDDGNGFADDVHGWDFVNNTALMRDNNGHGTHCAGIAAAVGGNGIGIAGANPDAIILPVTVLQSDGSGDLSTIMQGIDYAFALGADVFSLSFGTYSHSLALYDVLAKVYQKALIVAAAGNDMVVLNRPPFGAPFFPAAYNFVIGVMASDTANARATFSNIDQDGPFATVFNNEELYQYEVTAPGTDILSTYPGGNYRKLNGTSMACPLVAGAISRLYQCKDIASKEILFGDLIHTLRGGLSGVLDINATYAVTDADRTPTLAFVTNRIDDSTGGDGDLRPDAGETLEIYPTLRNFWGQARNVKVSVSLYGENEDQSIIDIIDGEVAFESELSSYSLNESKQPLRIKINDNCTDGRHIAIKLTATCDNVSETAEQIVPLVVENGIEIGGLIWEDMTLYPDKYYIVTSNVGICEDVTLTLMPGAKLHFRNGTGLAVEVGESELVQNEAGEWNTIYPHVGKIIAKGTPENRILFTQLGSPEYPGVHMDFGPNSQMEYVEIRDIFANGGVNTWNDTGIWRKCLFQYFMLGRVKGFISESAWYYNTDEIAGNLNCSIVRNQFYPYNGGLHGLSTEDIKSCNTFGNVINDNVDVYYASATEFRGAEFVTTDQPNYLGSTNRDVLRNWVWDIRHPLNTGWTYSPRSYAELDLSNILTRPNAKAPGVVWKIVVDGYNACDDYDMMPDLGVGRHKVEVYFSKRMNRAKTPTVAMGVRPPYTQIPVNEDAEWRTEVIDGDSLDVYTAWLTIRGRDTYDGRNRFYVGNAEDIEFFPIPIEDFRFHANVQSAGSMSAGFMAEPGVGKVTLTWDSPAENFDDMLGYNIYRYRPDVLNEEGLPVDTVRINTQLVENEEYIDYDIVPGNTYCYFYKVLRTSLTENSPSRVVSATPRAAGKGDSDGSGAVDVADVVTDVNYMVGRNPKPFIFDAADVNSDSEIDILDVVGTVNIIMAPAADASAVSAQSVAVYTIEDGILYVDCPVELAGVQISLRGERGSSDIRVLDGLTGMETTGQWMSDSEYRFLSFSLSGKTIAPGRTALLAVGDADVDNIILVNPSAQSVAAIRGDYDGISSVIMQQMLVPTPNPFYDSLNVPVTIGVEGNHSVVLGLVNLAGANVLSHSAKLGYGTHTVTLDTTDVPAGFYLLTLTVDGVDIQSCKVIKK